MATLLLSTNGVYCSGMLSKRVTEDKSTAVGSSSTATMLSRVCDLPRGKILQNEREWKVINEDMLDSISSTLPMMVSLTTLYHFKK